MERLANRLGLLLGTVALYSSMGISTAGSAWCQQQAAGPFNYVVVDSSGKILGPVAGVMQGTGVTAVVISVRGRPYPIYVQRTLIQPGTLFYATFDCTGQPYLDASSSPFPASSVVAGQDGKLLYGESGPVATVGINSYIDAYSGNCYPNTYMADVVPVSPVLNLSKFTPPFSVFPGR